MSTYTKIKTLPLSLFNNAEYLSFMNHVLDLANENSGGGDSESPDEISLLTGSDGIPSWASPKNSSIPTRQTSSPCRRGGREPYLAGDRANDLARYQPRQPRHLYHHPHLTAGTLPLEAERDAGKYLYKVIKPYNGIARLPMAQETAKIKGLLLDLRKDENKPYVTTLGLDAYLAELEKENNAYDRLSQQRVQNRTTSKKESGTNLAQADRRLLRRPHPAGPVLWRSEAVREGDRLHRRPQPADRRDHRRLQPAHGRLQETGARSRAYTRAYARRRLREPGRDLTVTSLPPTRKREIKREGKQFPFSFYSVYSRRKFLKQSDMETTTSLKTFEVTIPEKYADILKKFITSLEGKVKAQKKSGLDEALEDVKAGRIYHAESTKDLMKQILG